MSNTATAAAPETILVLERQYLNDCTVGALKNGNTIICHTLELAWRNNARRISCIPEGRYELVPNPNPKTRFPGSWLVRNVPNRSAILFHAGNDASLEDGNEDVDTMGCILPQTRIVYTSGVWRGEQSTHAFRALTTVLQQLTRNGGKVFIEIKSLEQRTPQKNG